MSKPAAPTTISILLIGIGLQPDQRRDVPMLYSKGFFGVHRCAALRPDGSVETEPRSGYNVSDSVTGLSVARHYKTLREAKDVTDRLAAVKVPRVWSRSSTATYLTGLFAATRGPGGNWMKFRKDSPAVSLWISERGEGKKGTLKSGIREDN